MSASIAAAIGPHVDRAIVAVGVLGLGVVGATTAQLVAAAGYRVRGYDRSAARIAEIAPHLHASGCEAATDPSVLAMADVLVIAVRAAVGADGETDLAPLSAAMRTLAALPQRQRLVLIETTVPPGTTRRVCESLPEGVRAQTLFAHCPERLRVGDGVEQVKSIPRLIGGLTSEATQRGCEFLSSIGIQAVPVSQPEVSELAKLLENAFLTTGIALMGEVGRLAHRLGVSATEVSDAAATKSHGYFHFRAGPGIGGHCLLNDMRMLRHSTTAVGVDSPLFAGVQSAAERLNQTVMERLDALARNRGIELQGSLVWLIGVGFKLGSADISGTPAMDLIRLLRSRGARVVFSDCQVNELIVDGEPVERVMVIPAGSFKAEVALLLSGDATIRLESVDAHSQFAFDVGGSRIMQGQSHRLERL